MNVGADLWEHKFKRCYRRMAALETAYMRRLLRHNPGVGGPPCTCEDCEWLRSLMDERLAERLKTEAERIVTVSTDFATAARRQMEQLDQDQQEEADAAVAAATARRDEIVRERTALERALATYDRAMTTPIGPKPTGPYRSGPLTGRAFLSQWAAEHDGVVVTALATPAAVLAGISPHAVKKAALDRADFERVERGVYRLRVRAVA